MTFSITFGEIEEFIKNYSGLELSMRQVSGCEVKIQPRNMGFFQNRVKVRLAIDPEYDVPNRIKMKVSAGVLSPIVVPKVLKLMSAMPEGSVAMQKNGNVIIFLDKIPQLAAVCSAAEIYDVCFCDETDEMVVSARFAAKKEDAMDDERELEEYDYNEELSPKERREKSILSDVARSIFESDKVDEGLQALKEKATELKDTHGDELKQKALSFLKNLRASHSDDTTE